MVKFVDARPRDGQEVRVRLWGHWDTRPATYHDNVYRLGPTWDFGGDVYRLGPIWDLGGDLRESACADDLWEPAEEASDAA